MKHQINVRVFYRPGRRGRDHSIKMLKQMCLATNNSVRVGTVVRLLRLPLEHLVYLRGEGSAPLEMEDLIRPMDEEFPVDLNLYVEEPK
jgi:hypothetical protein